MNPAVTLTFSVPRQDCSGDALFYVMFQFLGGIAGVSGGEILDRLSLQHSAVNYAVTVPGPGGP